MMTKTTKVAATLLLFSMTACTSLQPVAEPSAYFAKQSPAFVVVTTTEQTDEDDPLIVTRPQLQEGTLTGMAYGEPLAIPVTRVRTMSANQPNRGRTTLAIITGVAILGTLGYLAATSGDGFSEYECEAPCRGIGNGARIPR